jgi:hypothetical protein
MSLNTIYYFTSNWDFYTRQFIVYSGIDTSDGIGKSQLHNLTDVNGVINFPIIGQVAGLYKWNDKRTLNQIEQMAGYSVAPKGVVSLFRHGGYVIYEQSGHGLVVALYDIGREENHDAANTACENAEINGYNDWRLPSEAELWQIQNNIGVMGIGRFGWQCVLYWGSIITRGPAGAVDLWPKQCSSWGVPMVRAVRNF